MGNESMNKARVLVSRWMGLLCSGNTTVDTLHGTYSHQRQPPALYSAHQLHASASLLRGRHATSRNTVSTSCRPPRVPFGTITTIHPCKRCFSLFVQKPQGHVQLPQCNHQFPYDTAEHPKTRPDTMIIINTLHGHATRYARGPHVFRKADI